MLANPSIVVQDMLRKTPKPLDAVDMIFRFLVDRVFRMTHRVVFFQTLERVVAPKLVREVGRPLSGLLPDDLHEFIGRELPPLPSYRPSHHAPEGQKQCFCPWLHVYAFLSVCRQSISRPSRSRRRVCRHPVPPHGSWFYRHPRDKQLQTFRNC